MHPQISKISPAPVREERRTDKNNRVVMLCGFKFILSIVVLIKLHYFCTVDTRISFYDRKIALVCGPFIQGRAKKIDLKWAEVTDIYWKGMD